APGARALSAGPVGNGKAAAARAGEGAGGEPGRPAGLTSHVLTMPRAEYTQYLGDPFAVADRFPPPWGQAAPLASLSLPAEPLPPRTVEEVQRVLQRVKAHALLEGEDPLNHDRPLTVDNAESPALLGGVQVLVDGGRVVFERPGPDDGLMRGLWTLLPTRTRGELWPASFAFDNALGFDALVVPRADGPQYDGYTDEEQAAEYPPGSYELNLQIAAESGNQPD